jgi:hypothetical protein
MVCRSLRDSWCPPTPATIQYIDNNGQPQRRTLTRMKADGHTDRDIAKYLGVSLPRCIGTSPRTAQPHGCPTCVGLLCFEAGLVKLERLGVFADGADLGLVEPVFGDSGDFKAHFKFDASTAARCWITSLVTRPKSRA